MTRNPVSRGAALAALVLASAACGAAGGGGGDDTFVLKAVSSWERDDLQNVGFRIFMENVQEASNGRIEFDYVGGPESIPPDEQGQAIRTGVVDVANISTAYYASQLPAANTLNYTTLSAAEARDNGAMDYLSQLHEQQVNAKLLGRTLDMPFALFTKSRISTTEDLGNLRFRTSTTYIPLFDALGAEYVQMSGGEVYQALERGVVDGFPWPEYGMTDMGLQEQVTCKVLPTFWKVSNVSLMNLDTWNDLPSDLQDVVVDVSRQVETELADRQAESAEKEDALLEEAGVQTCELADSDRFRQIANTAGRQWMEQNLPTEQAQRLTELFFK